MKYTYAYKTSDGTRHEAAMEAESREDVFATLRRQGIRPIKVVAADGSKANGEAPAPKRAGAMVVGAIAGSALALLVASFAFFADGNRPATPAFLAEQTRRQVIGDAAVVDKGIATGWGDVFPDEGERFFASFAIPGVRAGQRNTTVGEIEAALARTVAASSDDGMEARQIKAMVEGMKDEMRRFIAAGGTIEQYGRRLVARQDEEIAIYTRAGNEIEQAMKGGADRAEVADLVDRRNGELRRMGIRLIAMPDPAE